MRPLLPRLSKKAGTPSGVEGPLDIPEGCGIAVGGVVRVAAMSAMTA